MGTACVVVAVLDEDRRDLLQARTDTRMWCVMEWSWIRSSELFR